MRKLLIALSVIGLLGGLAGPALGHSANGSHEEDTVDDETVFDNQVTCAEPDADGGDVPDVVTPIGGLYTTGSPEDASGGVEVCADDDTESPVLQGRILVEGSADGGGFVAADGDADNPEENSQGWARVDVSGDGVEIRCGSVDGNLDATHPGPEDTQDECG